MGAVTVITSGKGGVGKSTVAAGLGSALARREKRVLLIDGDAGLSCLDHMLDVAEERVYDVSDVISGGAQLRQAIYACPWQERMDLLAAPSREEDIVSPGVMRQLVGELSRYYDHVLIDCPAGIGAGFESAVAAAQRALVVSTPDPVCLRNGAKARMALERLGLRQHRLVINRFSGAAASGSITASTKSLTPWASTSSPSFRRIPPLRRRRRPRPRFPRGARELWPSNAWPPVWRANRFRSSLSANFSCRQHPAPDPGGEES